MRITALTENTAVSPELGAEHGLSLYIETENRRILFDAGQTGLFAENAERLGFDLAAVDIAVLSHGHYDHGGGLKRFLELNRKAPVYLSRRAFEPYFNGTEKYIGLDEKLKESERLIFTDEQLEIGEGLTLFSCNDRERRFGFSGKNLLHFKNGEFIPDDFSHEQYLLIEEYGKRVLFSACSHKGILNIVGWFKPDYLIGGFHFMKLECGAELSSNAAELDKYNTIYYTCHCTGVEQFRFMEPRMKNLNYLSAGMTIEI